MMPHHAFATIRHCYAIAPPRSLLIAVLFSHVDAFAAMLLAADAAAIR